MKDREFVAKTRLKGYFSLIILLIVLLISIIFSLAIGSTRISALLILKLLIAKIAGFPGGCPDYFEVIVLHVRLPRILLGALVGAALGISGCAMQGLFRNSLASPYVSGIASASAFGASLAIILGLDIHWSEFLAFLISSAAAFFVYYIAKVRGKTDVGTLLLGGIAISLFFSALVSFTQYIAGEQQLRSIVFWLMGGLWASNWDKFWATMPVIFSGSVMMLFFSRDLNILLNGEEQAQNLGVETESVRKIVLLLASLVTACAVSTCGIIGFVGLIVPHTMRIFVGHDHRILLLSSFLGGAIFLLWADTLARIIIAPAELPVGIITALIGVPFFLILLRANKRKIWF